MWTHMFQNHISLFLLKFLTEESQILNWLYFILISYITCFITVKLSILMQYLGILHLQKSFFFPVHRQQPVMQIKNKTVPSRSRVDVHEARASAPHLHYGTRGLACWSQHLALVLTSFPILVGSCVRGHLLHQLVPLYMTVIIVRWFLIEVN